MSEVKLNIYQRINAVMKDVGYIKKGSAGQGTGVLHDDVIAMIRGCMIDHGIIPVLTEIVDVFNMENQKSKQQIYCAKYQLELVNMDDPSDAVKYTQSAHAADNGDKGPGKLSTYAIKVMYVKAFALESGINDESRSDTQDRIDGNLAANGAEVTAMHANIKTIDESKLEKAYGAFSSKVNATREQIETGELTQIQVHKINHMIQKSKDA